jgi:predicted short-subunit dehydrogenase-like oxidoreductase (DUF2520 family)
MANHDARRSVQKQLPRLAVIGVGRAGGSILRGARQAGIEAVGARRDELLEASRGAEAALICAPDSAIAAVAEELTAAVPPLRFVGHVSGASGLDDLAAAERAGAWTFSLHPLQTLPDAESYLRGAACAVAGSSAGAAEFARTLARALGMHPFALAEEQRAAYHAAASIASNFLVALAESAIELLDRIGVEDGRERLAPLVLRSAESWSERGRAALTGPIARGDEATIERHREAIAEAAPELLDLYNALARRTRAIAAGEAVGAATP